jgi:signal transduction histidine kinase/ligand-binding sensor domain-containing protein
MRFAVGITLLALRAWPAFGLDPTRKPTQYVRTGWTQKDGLALGAVEALAQTKDGYLWLGAAQGLLRFDGVRFSNPRPEIQGVLSLAASRSGALWIGRLGGVSKLDNAKLVDVSAVLPRPRVLAEDRDGALWIAMLDGGLARLKGQTITRFGAPDSLPDLHVNALFLDDQGCVWAGTKAGLIRWTAGRVDQFLTKPPINIQGLAADAHGRLIAAAGRSIVRLVDGQPQVLLERIADATLAPNVMLRDRDGNLWVGTAGQGLIRFRDGAVERLTRKDGLSSETILSLLEDREGDLWVGTLNGVDRLRDAKVSTLSTVEGLSGDLITALWGSRDGSLWVGTSANGLNRVRNGAITQYQISAGLPTTTILSLHEDSAGRLWTGTTGGLAYLQNNRFIEAKAADGGHLERVYLMAGARDGQFWLADMQRGLLRLRDGSLAAPKPVVYQMCVDRAGALWLGYLQGGVKIIHNGRESAYASGRDLASGAVQSLFEDRAGTMWVGTAQGLSRFRGGRWTNWTAPQGIPDGGAREIIEDDRGYLWLTTAQGVMRVRLAELDAVPDGSPGPLKFALYGLSDGMRSRARTSMANPRIAKTRDGRLWFATDEGVATIDPAHIRANPLPPPVVIEGLAVDRRALALNGAADLAFRGRELELNYTALSLANPDKVRFRYQMEGFDRDWIDAGARRQAFYTNLPPRRYRFRVIASNDDGVWNTTGAELSFRIPPAFYQTWWFAALCAAALCALGWAVHRLRLRRVRARFQVLLHERLRLARELHDTLLQGFAGVIYQLEAASRQFHSAPEASKERLDRALEQLDRCLREARGAISYMRLPTLEDGALPQALTAVGEQLTRDLPIHFEIVVKGRPRPLPYATEANLYAIAREAMANAVNHGCPGRLTLELAYADRELRVTVSDDGAGFDLSGAPPKNDHWGLVGMRERATELGADFRLTTEPGHGSAVEITVKDSEAPAR